MKLAIVVIWSFFIKLTVQQGGPPSLPNNKVQAIVLMGDGKQDGVNYVENFFQLSVNENSEEGFTLCFWMFPYRYHKYDSLITLSFMGMNRLTLRAAMVGGGLVVSVNTVVDRFVIYPSYRNWNYYCVLVNKTIDIYSNGTMNNSTNKAPLPPLLPYGNKLSINCTFALGARGKTETSMSGEIADIRFYAKYLSPQEMDNYKIRASNITKYLSFPMQTPTTNTGVTFKTYTFDDLNQEYEPFFIMDFEITSTFQDANNVCKKYKSRLPDVEDGELWLVNLFTTYSTNTQIDLSQFWVTNSSSNGCILASITSGSVSKTNISCVSETVSQFGCITLKVLKLKLLAAIGTSQRSTFHPIPFQNGVYENNDTRIVAASGTIQLSKISTQQVLGIAFADDLVQTMGRRDCFDNNHKLVGQITLSACEDTEFTCTNGNCISITKACDFQNDCGDNSDESVCQPFMPITGLNDFIRADNPIANGTLPLDITLVIYKILDVNLKDGKIQYFLDMTVQWIDRRLSYKFLNFNYVNYVPQSVANTFWQPKITASETLEDEDNFNLFLNPGDYSVKPFNNGTIGVSESYEALLYDGKDVTEIHRKQSNISTDCDMNLFYFPMDTQTCCMNLSLQSVVGKPDSSWNPNTTKAFLDPNLKLPLYDITHFSYSIGDDPQTFGFCITLHRKSGGFMCNTFFPCILVEIIGLMTNMFPVHAYENRVGVTLSCMFVVAALFKEGSSELPESAEPRMMDIFIFVNIIVLFLVFVIHVMIIFYHDKTTNEKNSELTVKGDDIYGKFEDIPVERMIGLGGKTKSAWLAASTLKTSEKLNNRDSITPSPEIINKIGGIICVCFYAAFVIVYMGLSYFR